MFFMALNLSNKFNFPFYNIQTPNSWRHGVHKQAINFKSLPSSPNEYHQRLSFSHKNYFQTNSIYNAPFKRTSGTFGSRLWSDLPLSIDECGNNDIDFHQLPVMRKKFSENDKVLRTNSLQSSLPHRIKQPLARHISSPMRFNNTTETDRASGTSYTGAASKISFRNFLRRMSSKRRKPLTELSQVEVETHCDKRKSVRKTSIRFELNVSSTISNNDVPHFLLSVEASPRQRKS